MNRQEESFYERSPLKNKLLNAFYWIHNHSILLQNIHPWRRTSWWTTPASAPATRRLTHTPWTLSPPATMPRMSVAETRSHQDPIKLISSTYLNLTDLQQENGLLHKKLSNQKRPVRYDRCVSILLWHLVVFKMLLDLLAPRATVRGRA